MKKILAVVLGFSFILSLIGCANTPEETPTVAIASSVVSRVESTVQNVDGDTQKDAEENSVASQSVQQEEQVVSRETESSAIKQSNSNDTKVEKDEPVEENLEFTTEAQLKNWFKNGTQVANAVSPEALQTMQQGKAVTYLRPAISANNNLVSLKNIVVEKATIGYEYSFVGQEKADLVMIAHLKDFDQLFYEEFETNLSKEKENYFRTLTNGIEYLYMRNVSSDSVVFVWKQNGVVHSAILYGHYDQVDQILPLLKLETVTVQTDNQSHVTQ